MGAERASDERELILCNLCVRRSAFDRVGGFDERLYPNEENEFLDRVAGAGFEVLYIPEAAARRPAPAGFAELCARGFRYGRGRGEELRVRPERKSFLRAGLALAWFGALGGAALSAGGEGPLCALPAFVYLVLILGAALRSAGRRGLTAGLGALLLTPVLHGAYGAGLLAGALRPRGLRRSGVEIKRVVEGRPAPEGGVL